MAAVWKKIRHRLEYAGASFLAWMVPKLSRRACIALARGLGAVAFRLDRRGREVALANLAAAFGETRSETDRRRIACASYQAFARTMLDLFWAQRITSENSAQYIRLENSEAIATAVKSGAGALFLLSHHGNFEWAHLAIGFAGYGGFGVQETFKNPLLTGLFTRVRGVAGNTVVEQDRSVLRFFKHLKKGGTAGLLIDLTLRPDQPAAVIDAFGLKMCVTFMHAELHRRTGAPLFVLQSIPENDGTCRVIVHGPFTFSPETPAHEIAQACWNLIEPMIRARPELWMWPYKHWRYKPRETTREYPFYAHHSSRFEKLLRSQTPLP